MKIANTNVNTGISVLVVERNAAGAYSARSVPQNALGNGFFFSNSVAGAYARIEPTAPQIQTIVNALADGTLQLSDIDGIGGEHGGFTTIDLC